MPVCEGPEPWASSEAVPSVSLSGERNPLLCPSQTPSALGWPPCQVTAASGACTVAGFPVLRAVPAPPWKILGVLHSLRVSWKTTGQISVSCMLCQPLNEGACPAFNSPPHTTVANLHIISDIWLSWHRTCQGHKSSLPMYRDNSFLTNLVGGLNEDLSSTLYRNWPKINLK